MASRHVPRSLPGHLAFLLAALVVTVVAVTAVYSFFYEGWGQPARGGRNAGCTWDGRSSPAMCAQPPDKETPLWAPDQPAIYYLTTDASGEQHTLGVNYTGGITAHRRISTSRSVGYRCAKASSSASMFR